jgi:hypothetical protein
MTLNQFYNLAKKAGFCFWESESWKPEGAVIDWAAQYDKEMVKLYELIVQHYDDNLTSNVEVDLTDEELLVIFKMAHERDITLNKMVNIILENALRADESKKEQTWIEESSLKDQD